MTKTLAALAGAACLLLSTAAQATQYKLDFTVGSFTNNFVTLERAPIAGAIVFSADAFGAAVTSVDAVDLAIDGHAYTPGQIGAELWGSHYAFGARAYDVGGVQALTDDFYIYINGFANDFQFATSGSYLYFGRDIVASYSALAPAGDVPEPGSPALLLAGSGALAMLARPRRRRG
jgi:hypothetical protein